MRVMLIPTIAEFGVPLPAAALAAGAAFLVVDPYAVLDWHHFWHGDFDYCWLWSLWWNHHH